MVPMLSVTTTCVNAWRVMNAICPICVSWLAVVGPYSAGQTPFVNMTRSRELNTVTVWMAMKGMLLSVARANLYLAMFSTIVVFMLVANQQSKFIGGFVAVAFLNCFISPNRDPAYYECQCHAGFNGDGYVCIEDQNCLNTPQLCDMNAQCLSTNSGLVCVCNKGKLDGTKRREPQSIC